MAWRDEAPDIRCYLPADSRGGKVIVDGKDWSNYVRDIRVDSQVRGLTVVTMEFFANVGEDFDAQA